MQVGGRDLVVLVDQSPTSYSPSPTIYYNFSSTMQCPGEPALLWPWTLRRDIYIYIYTHHGFLSKHPEQYYCFS